MKKVKVIRLVTVIVLIVMFLVMSLYLFLPRRGDSDSGVTAVCFIDEDRLFPQMDYRQLFSALDISSAYSVGEELSLEQMKDRIDKASKEKKADTIVLLCDGDYAVSGLMIAKDDARIKTLVLLTPSVPEDADLSEFGTKVPATDICIFAEERARANSLYERLSGEDTKFTQGVFADTHGMSLYISPDTTRYFGTYSGWTKSPALAGSATLNHPVVQSYLANYLKNHALEQEGLSRAPMWIWVMKVLCTMFVAIAFFVYVATLPGGKKKTHDKDAVEKAEEETHRMADGRLKLKNRSIFVKYKASLVHLMGLQLLLGAIFAVIGAFFVGGKTSNVKHVLLIWMFMSFFSSAFFLLRYIRKLPKKDVRAHRAMFPMQIVFVAALILDIFLLTLLWRGTGFLHFSLLLVIAVLLSIMVAVSLYMLDLTDNFYMKSQGQGNGVLDSIRFSAIRFVPIVIVLLFSIIMDKEICTLQIMILSAALLGSAFLRRIVKRGALGDVLSVVLYACLYWMMF